MLRDVFFCWEHNIQNKVAGGWEIDLSEDGLVMCSFNSLLVLNMFHGRPFVVN